MMGPLIEKRPRNVPKVWPMRMYVRPSITLIRGVRRSITTLATGNLMLVNFHGSGVEGTTHHIGAQSKWYLCQ